jgi:hypothetical protein
MPRRFRLGCSRGQRGRPQILKSKSVCVFVPYCDEERELQCQDPLLLPNGKQIPCVEKTVCLGHAIAGTLSDADHVSVRASKGSQVFRALGPCLLRCSYVWTDVKRLVFESMIVPTMLDGIECCVLSTVMIEKMTTVHHRLMRSALHITPYKQRKWKLTSEELLSRIGLQPEDAWVRWARRENGGLQVTKACTRRRH